MSHLPESPDADRPVGTLALLAGAALLMTLAWLFLYFGVFLPRGALS